MKSEYKFDAFKIRNRNFLLVTLKFTEVVTDLTYEILGDKGNRIVKNINTNGDTQVFITIPINDNSERIVFKYTFDGNVDFCFLTYEDLLETSCDTRGSSNNYMVSKNIHMDMSVEEATHTSSSVEDGDIIDESDEFSENSGRFSDDIDNMDEMDMDEMGEEEMYRPISDDEDMARMFHLEDCDSIDARELDILEKMEIGGDDERDNESWSPIDLDVSKKNETTDVTSMEDVTPESLDSISKEA